MNLFRSEEHVRNWAQFKEGTEEGIVPLADLVELFSGSYFRKRLEPDWVSHSGEYRVEILATLKKLGRTGPFWKPPQQ
jgi:hypothetical protein